MKRIALAFSVFIISVSLAFGTASAFNAADLQKLKTTRNCVECDLSGAVLIHWVLSGADLSGANLAGASLAHASLFRAKLSEASLYVVGLSGATWTNGSQCERGSVGAGRENEVDRKKGQPYAPFLRY